MVNNELNYEIDEDDEDEEQGTQPAKKVDSKEKTSKQAVNQRPGDDWPVDLLQMIESQLFSPGCLQCQDEEQHGRCGE